MRQSKTTIKELTAQYRAVLKHAFFAGVAAVALSTTGAIADITIADVVNNTKTGTAVMPSVSDSTYQWDKDGDGTADAELTVDEDNAVTTTLNESDYQYASHAGVWNNATGPTAVDTDANQNAPQSGSYTFTDTKGTEYFGTDTTINPTTYSYTKKTTDNPDGTPVYLAASDVGQTTLSTDGYEYAVTSAYRVNNSETSAGIGSDAANAPKYSDYQFTDSFSNTHNLNDYVDEATGNIVLPAELMTDGVAASNAAAALNAFTTDRNSYNIVKGYWTASNDSYTDALDEVAGQQDILTAMNTAYSNDVTAQSEAQAKRNTANQSLADITSAWNAAVGKATDYNNSMAKAVDDRANNAIRASLADDGDIGTALAGKQDTLTEAQLAAVDSGIDATKVAQIATNATAIDTINNSDVMTSGIDATKVAQIATNATAIDTINSSDVMTSGITADKVSGYDTHIADTNIHITADERTTWNAKQDALSTEQLAAANSGITADKVSTYDGYADLISANTDDILTLRSDVDANTSAINDLSASITAGDNKLRNDIAALDSKMNDLDENLSAGIASSVALSSVAVSNVKQGEMSVGGGYGNYNSKSAMAFGAALGITDNWSANAGVGFGFGKDTKASFRVGTNYKFKLF